jgi:hypothetical protein
MQLMTHIIEKFGPEIKLEIKFNPDKLPRLKLGWQIADILVKCCRRL